MEFLLGRAPIGSAHRKPRKARRPAELGAGGALPALWKCLTGNSGGHGTGAPGLIRPPPRCQRARCHPTRPCDRCPLPPGCHMVVSWYIHVFSTPLFFQKISCGEQGATRAEEFRPFSQRPPQTANPRHSPPSKSTAPALPRPSRRHQRGTTNSPARKSPGAAEKPGI